MKNTNKLICSLFAIIAVAFLIGSAFSGIANDINGADEQVGNDVTEPYAVYGISSSGSTLYKEFDDLQNAANAANLYAETHTNVKVIVQQNVEYEATDFVVVLNDGINFEVKSGVTFTFKSQLAVKSGIVDVKGKMIIEKNGLIKNTAVAINDRNCLSVKNGGSIEILNGAGIFIRGFNDINGWIGGNNLFSLIRTESEESKIIVKTVGDTISGFEYGIVIEVADEAEYRLYTDVEDQYGAKYVTTLHEFDKLIMKSPSHTAFYRFMVEDGAQVYMGDTQWVGKDSMHGDATIDTGASGGKVPVLWSYKMTIDKGKKVILDYPTLEYEIGTLVIDGTLILNKKIKIGSGVDISGNLVLANRDFLSPIDSSISVELEGDGIITLIDNNKWYGKGAALDPTLISNVKLTIVALENGTTSYHFDVKGFVCINYVDIWSYFELRGQDSFVISQGFLLVNGPANIINFKEGDVLPFKTEGISGIAVTCAAEVWLHYTDGLTGHIVGKENAFIELADKELTEKQIAAIEEAIGDSEILKKIRAITMDSLLIAKSNSAGGLNVDIAGMVFTRGLPIGPFDVYKVVGVMSVMPNWGTTFVHDGGKLEVVGELIVMGPLAITTDGTLKVIGVTKFSGEDSQFSYKGTRIVGYTFENPTPIFSISKNASLTTISTSKWTVAIATIEDGSDEYGVRFNKEVALGNICFIVGYDHVKITKEMDYLGLSEDDISALDTALGLDKIEIKEKSGRVKVVDGGSIIDPTGHGFLIIGGDATFEYGSKYVVGGKTIVDSDGDAVFKLLETGAKVKIGNHLISEKLLDELKAKDPKTEYANILFGKSYTLSGKIKVTGLTVKYNEKIVYKEKDTLGGFLVFGEAWANGAKFIGHDDTFQFELENLSSMMAVDHAESSKAVAVGGLVTLHGDFTVDEKTQLIIRSEQEPESKTILTVGEGVAISISRKYLVIEGATETDPVVKLTENVALTIDGTAVTGNESVPITIGKDACIDLTFNTDGGVNMHTFGLVTVNTDQIFVVAEKDKLTVSNDPEFKSFTVKGTLVIEKKDNFVIEAGEVYVASTATVKIGEDDNNIIFGKDQKALFTAGDDVYLLISNGLSDGMGIKVFGKSTDDSTITLNKEKKYTVSGDGFIILVDSKLNIDEKAEFVVTNRASIAVAVTEEYKSETFTPSIVGVGGDDACLIDINGFIDFRTYESTTKVGFFGEQIIITAKELPEIEGDEPSKEILESGAVNKATISGDVSRGKGYTVLPDDVIETVSGEGTSSFKVNANLVVKGELVVKSTSLTLGKVKTEGTGKITVFGNDGSSIMIDETQYVGKGTVEGPFVFGGEVKIEAKTNTDGGFDIAIMSGTVTLRNEFYLGAKDVISVQTGGKLVLDAKLTVNGKLTIGDGSLVVDEEEYLCIVEDNGSLNLLTDSDVTIDGVHWFGTDGNLSVRTGSVTYKKDVLGLKMYIEKAININDNVEFTFPGYRMVFDEWGKINVGNNATLKFDSDPGTLLIFKTGVYINYEIGAKFILEGEECIGPNGTVLKTSGEEGKLSTCLTSNITQWYTGLTIRLEDGEIRGPDTKGITVEVMPKKVEFISLCPVYVQEHCKLVFGDGMDIKITGDKFNISGQLIIGKSKLIVDGKKLHFELGSTFIWDDKYIVGEQGINPTNHSSRIEVGVDVNDVPKGQIRINVDIYGESFIKEGATVLVGQLPTGEEYVLSLKEEKTRIDVYGTLVANVKELNMYGNSFRFHEGSSFTLIDSNDAEQKIIGKDGSIVLAVSEEAYEPGYLAFTPNSKGGYDMSLVDEVEATVQKAYTVTSKDAFTVGESASLILNDKLTVECKTMIVNGLLRFNDGKIDLADGSMIKLVYGSTLMFGDTVFMGDEDNEDAIVTMMGEGGIFMSKNGQGWKYDVISEITINDKDGGFVIDSKDVFVIENNVTILGMVSMQSLNQVTVSAGKTVTLLSVLVDDKYVFHAGLTTVDRGIIIAADENAMFNVTGSNTKFVFKMNEKGTNIDFTYGEATLTKDLTISENSEFVIGKDSKLSIAENATFVILGKCTVNGGELIVNGSFDFEKGTFFVGSYSTVVYRDNVIIGSDSDAFISIRPTIGADGFIAFDNKDMRFVCNGLVTLNREMAIPEGYTLYLDNCQMMIRGSIKFLGDLKMELHFNSSISFFVGTSLSEKAATTEHVIIGTDDASAEISISGIQTPVSKFMITSNDSDSNDYFIMAGIGDNFTVTLNEGKTFILPDIGSMNIGTDSTLVVNGTMIAAGKINIHGTLRLAQAGALVVTNAAYVHITFGANFYVGEEKIIGSAFDAPAHYSVIELMNGLSYIDVVVNEKGGYDMTLAGHSTINPSKTLSISEKSELFVAGKLDVAGELIVDSNSKVHAYTIDPNYPVTSINLMNGTSKIIANVEGSIDLQGYIFSDSTIAVDGNVNLCGDLTLNGYLSVNGNLILMGHSIDGFSKTVYVRGAVTLDGVASNQLDHFYGTIRAYEYHDGPMKYVDSGKVVVTWTLKVVTEGIPQFYWTETNKMGGFATIMIPLKENQKATITVIAGNGQVMQVSDNVWYVYSYGFDVTVKVVIEDVGPSSDYDLRINEIVDQGKHPGFTSKLVSNTEQYIATGDLEIHYVFKTLIKGKWVFSVSGFSAGVENWLTHIEASETLYSATCGGVLVKGDHVPAGSYLVSGYATFTVTDESGAKQYWVSPTIVSVSDVPVPDDQVSEIFSAVLLRTEA